MIRNKREQTTTESDQSFVVITGDPQQGHGARLSQARSHLAKQYHGKRRSQMKNARQVQQILTLHHVLNAIPRDLHQSMQVPPSPVAVPGYNRMERFMYDYVHSSRRRHRFFSTVIYAAITHPPLMSAKILNASAWDDLSHAGDLSDITLRQSNITRHLLNGALADAEQCISDVTAAALITVLLFDLMNGDINVFEHDRACMDRILGARGGVGSLGFEGRLDDSLLLIDHFQRIETRPLAKRTTSSSLDLALMPYAGIDSSVFTFRKDRPLHPASQSLTDLYRLTVYLASPASGRIVNDNGDSIAHLSSLEQYLSATEQSNHHNQKDIELSRNLALDQARYLLSLSDPWPENDLHLAAAIFQLKILLLQTDMTEFWDPIPGALIWCLVIGARRCPPGPTRKWFMMQAQRTCCAMAQESCDMVIRSLRVVLAGLDGAPLRTCGLGKGLKSMYA